MFVKTLLNQKIVALLGILILLLATPVLAAPSYADWDPATSIESVPGSSLDLNTPFLDGCPILSRDGLKLYIASNRPDRLDLDIWVAERESADGSFGATMNVSTTINREYNDFCPSPLRDGHGFQFVSNRPGGCGGADIYLTRYNPGSG